MSKSIYTIGTMDTKGAEVQYVAEIARAAGNTVTTVDVGTKDAPTAASDITRHQVASHHPSGVNHVLSNTDRGQAVNAMSEALIHFLLAEHASGKVTGVIGLGGTGGTALISPALRALPIGMPKLLVSTVASGNTAQYVGCCDITMMYSVVDVAGLNRVSRRILSNAALAIAGMAASKDANVETISTIGMTMFGVTTPCVTAVRNELEHRGHECLVFHATGTGGQAMEKLVDSGMINAVLDITTTEVADEIVGGVFPAGPRRFEVILRKQIPYVMSLGALDMVNFGAVDTVPEQFRSRNLYVHNSQVTLMRTTSDENRQFARWIASKINESIAPLILLIPEKGVSSIDAPGHPFYDPESDAALFDELSKTVRQTASRQIRRLPYNINDSAFSGALIDAYCEVSTNVLTHR